MTVLLVPWPPSTNCYWRLGNGRLHISKEGQEYKHYIMNLLEANGIKPLDGKAKLTIDAYPPDKRRRDIDNLLKCLFDSCIARQDHAIGLYHDDSQVKRLEATMHDYQPEHAGQIILTASPWTVNIAQPV